MNQKYQLLAATLLAVAGVPSFAATYSDTPNDNFDGNAHMDITSTEVYNDVSSITFKLTLRGSIEAPNDWGKYVIGLDLAAGTGDFGDPVGNPWGRNIRMADGIDAWIGSWADGGGGFQTWLYSGGTWNMTGSGAAVISGNSISLTAPLSSLGLSLGNSFQFDAYTTGGGGGDSANDSAANPAQSTTGWSGPYTTPAGAGLTYTVVPEPGSLTLALVGAGLLFGFCRRKR